MFVLTISLLHLWSKRISIGPPTDPPGITLLRGDDGAGTIFQWRIWCTDDQLRVNEADIGTISAVGDYNYEVKIQNPTDNGHGARNLAGCNLTPAAGQYSNILDGSRIAGDLLGNLTLQRSSGNGGVIWFTIDGDIPIPSSVITIPALGKFNCSSVAGTIIVNDGAYGGMGIGDILSTGQVEVSEYASISVGDIHGRLDLLDGIALGHPVIANSVLGNGVIDLHGKDLYDSLYLIHGGDGSILNGGVVHVDVDLNDAGVFSGYAEFASTATFSSVRIHGGIFAGTVYIDGDRNVKFVLRVDVRRTGQRPMLPLFQTPEQEGDGPRTNVD